MSEIIENCELKPKVSLAAASTPVAEDKFCQLFRELQEGKLQAENAQLAQENQRLKNNIAPWLPRAVGAGVVLIVTAVVFGILGNHLILKDATPPQIISVLVLCLLWTIMCVSAAVFLQRLR